MANVFDKDHQVFFKLLDKHQVEYLLIGGVAITKFNYSSRSYDIYYLSTREVINHSAPPKYYDDGSYVLQ